MRYMDVELYSHVMHIVSDVQGKVEKGINFDDEMTDMFNEIVNLVNDNARTEK